MRRALLLLLWIPAALVSAGAPPPLPTPITSFGGTASDGYVYAFGGHKGKAHEYSKQTVSGALQRLSLTELAAWEELPGTTPLQSPGLTSWKGKIYLAGGMQPRNAPGQPQRLVSLDYAAAFDPADKAWHPLPALPEPRSSHAVAVLEDKLYAVGGWPLSVGTPEPGEKEGPAKKYHDTIVTLDLAHPEAGWTSAPQPFKRRALAAIGFEGKIWCIGGMTEDNDLSSEVDIYDLHTGQWTKGPEVPEAGQAKGFGCAVCTGGGALYLSPQGTQIYKLSPDAKSWAPWAKLATGRYFHALVYLSDGKLMALGGTKGGAPIADVEIVWAQPKP